MMEKWLNMIGMVAYIWKWKIKQLPWNSIPATMSVFLSYTSFLY